MDTYRLSLLEQSAEPYRRAGFIITSQSEGAITLTIHPEKFSYIFFFITLLLLWPIAVIYLISYNSQRSKSVCLRITSQGDIEASGYTLGVLARERRRRRFIHILLYSLLALVILLILVRVYLSRMP